MSLRPGDSVEHFKIVSLLGRGGMGQVYVALDTRLQRNVALKIVHPEDGVNESARGSDGAARLLREAQSAAALDHPNVVTIYEVGQIHAEGDDAGRPFIAMELVRGRSLRTYVGDTSVPLTRRIQWLADIARALGAAHQARLVHRDVKPENVMVRDDGAIKVLDFGVAKRAAAPSLNTTTSTEAQILPSLTAKGVAVGTPYYMAPEQMRREPLDGRADQFAWGTVAYELLSGTPAWGREVDALELVSKLLTEEPSSLAEAAPDVPLHVVRVVARAMSKKRAERFATMEELIAALDDSSGVLAPTIPRIPVPAGNDAPAPLLHSSGAAAARSASPRGSRRATVLSLALVGLAVTIAGVGWLGLRGRNARRSATAPVEDAAPASDCTRATECIAKAGGKPAVCNRAGKCALIETTECKALYEPGDLKRDDTVWIGAMFPQTGEEASYGVTNMNAVELGRRDFASASDSLRAPDGTSLVHPLAVVACDDASPSNGAAAHLVRDLQVPAVIGFGQGATVDLATSIFVPNDVATMASVTLNPQLANVPHAVGQPRMVWRTTYDNAETAKAIAALATRFESDRSNRKPADHRAIRVAIVREQDPGISLFAETLFAELRFNGKSALENGNAWQEFSYARGDRGALTNLAKRVAQFEPALVVVFAEGEIVPEVEALWPSSSTSRPDYVTPYGFDSSLLDALRQSDDLRHRVFGFTGVSTTTTNARFVIHYNEVFRDEPPITRALAPNSSYDAFYLVAYGTLALGPKPVSGRALVGAFARLLPPGHPVEVGVGGILGAFAALNRGETIDLLGATGRMDFDPTTGEAPVDLAVLCAARDPRSGVIDQSESGLVFDAAMGRFVGEPRCP